MVRITSILILIVLFLTSAGLAESVNTSRAIDKEEGYALLEHLILTFKTLAEEGTGDVSKIDEALSGAMAAAIKANSENKVDPVFFKRYNRVLMIIKLIVVEDRTGILGSLVGQELGNFVEDVKGIRGELTGGKGIANVADAITEEIINLHLYLDNKEKKKKLREEIEQKFGAQRSEGKTWGKRPSKDYGYPRRSSYFLHKRGENDSKNEDTFMDDCLCHSDISNIMRREKS